jgi:chromate transporter
MANLDGEQVPHGASHTLTTGTLVSVADAGRPSLWLLLRVWFMLGLQSFGGGMATLYLIRRATVERRQWLTAEEFTRDWALCQAAPGINLLCMTILVGRQVAGLAGAVVAMIGLLLPSVTITIIMIALYADLRTLPVVQAALRGVVPGTIGLGLLLTVTMARPLLVRSYRESASNLLVGVFLLVGSALGVLVWRLPVIVVLCSAGAIGALTSWRHSVRTQTEQEKRSRP